jgi:outer membrane receptor protein involved in Fe transport
MLRRKVLSLATVLVSLITSGSAVAQDATTPPPAAPPPADVVVGEAPAAATPAGDKEQTEEIVVTGTRIRRKDLTTPAPVTVISRDQIAASGKVRIGDFLQALPEQGNAINTQFNNGGDGSTRVSLRGLGSARTLVLINGRRVVPGGVGADASVDLNSIPSQAIERIEILKDGASAVYGSDAIAGVINLITRKTLDGANLSAFAGTTSEGDGTMYDVSVSSGTSGPRGNLLFSAGYSEQNPIWAGNRGWSGTPYNYVFANPVTGAPDRVRYGGSIGTPAGNVDLYPSECTTARCAAVFADPANIAANEGPFIAVDPVTGDDIGYTFVPDATNPTGYRVFQNPADLYNYQPDNYILTPQQRIQLFAIGDTRFSDVARGYFEASYVNRQSTQKLAPEPLFADMDPLFVSGESIYNPFGTDLSWVGRRLTEFGRRTFQQDLDTFRVVGGVDGTLPDLFGPLSGWFWDVSLNYGRTQGVSTTQGTLRAPLVQNAIGPSYDPDGSVVGPDHIRGTLDDPATPVANGDEVCVRSQATYITCLGMPETTAAERSAKQACLAAATVSSCVPLNLLGGPNTITSAMVGGLGFTGTDRGNNQLTSFQVNSSGDLFQLLADRPVGLAVGYEYRNLRGAFIPNPITAAFENTGNNTSAAKGSYDVNEVYGELSIPIVSNLPFAQDLEATLAARYFKYSTFGDDATYKAGLRWRIIPDVTVRGTYSTAFRAPSISDLYSGQYESFEGVSDPCAGGAPGTTGYIAPTLAGPDGIPGTADDVPNPLYVACGAAANNRDIRTQQATLFGGNPELDPETADIFTLGVVWEPQFVKNLSFTADYYNIKVDHAIDTIGAGTILETCYPGDAGVAPKNCDLVKRNPATNLIQSITDTTTNVGGTDTDGIDVAARYQLPTAFGRFGFVFDGTWLHKYDTELADGTVVKGKGTYDLGMFPEFKFNTGMTWGLKGFGAGLTTRYIGSFRECSSATGRNTGGLCYLEDERAAAAGRPSRQRTVDAWATTDVFVSYALKSTAGRTAITLGMNNVLDDNPRTVYTATTTYFNSDPTAYDYLGRFVYARLDHTY